MKDLRELERKRLIKELDYVRSDLEYKSEVVYEADNSFMKSINKLLNEKPLLKEMFDAIVGKKIEKMLENVVVEIAVPINREKDTDSMRKLKKAYREIAKITHPDIVKDKNLNELYIKASLMMENADMLGIYEICEILGIRYTLGDEDGDLLRSQIESIKERILFMESTFSWKWHHTENEQEKNMMLLEYIKSKII
jgi:hypothetical protein